MSCREARETIQDQLDGPVAAERDTALRAHLAVCEECRQVREGMFGVRASLRGLDEIPFPDDALDEVWSKTVRARRVVPVWARSAAAAVLVVVSVGAALVLLRGGPEIAEPTPAEIARAEAEVRAVLSIASRALHRTERAAVEQVLAGEVSPALGRIPIRWVETRAGHRRRNGT